MDDVTPEDLGSFQGLYHLLVNYEGADCFAEILRPAIPSAARLMEPLRRHRKRQPGATFSDHEDEAFFALSVVNDLLRVPMRVSEREYRHFFEALGFSPFGVEAPFNPIRHEIVQVSNLARPEEGIQVWGSWWPGLLFGDLIFSRAAAGISCHPSHQLREGIADRTTLYATYHRINRPTYSPAHGWGSNSRWRTSFRFDYEEPEQLLFNVHHSGDDLADPARLQPRQGAPGPGEEGELSLERRRELLVHRCFVSYDHPEALEDVGGNWSIHRKDTLAVRRSDVLWPLSESLLIRQSEVKPPVP